MTIVETTRHVTGGVDTHVDVHVAAVVDHLGGVLGIEAFETTEAGYQRLIGWLRRMAPSTSSVWRAPGRMGRG